MNPSQKPNRKVFKPTAQMTEAAENVFVAMAFEQTIRPVVEAYKRKVLAERKWPLAPNMLTGLQRRSDQPIEEHVTDIKYAWMMTEADFAIYDARCNEERIAANLHVESEGQCPLLVAEEATRLAKRALCDAMSTVTNIPAAKAVTLKQADYDSLVDLSLKLLAPFVTSPLSKLVA